MKFTKTLQVLFVAVLMSMTSCKSTKTIPMQDLDRLSGSSYSEFNQTEQTIIKDNTALESVYNRIATREAMPRINWDKQQVVLLALGQRNTGGFSIDISEVVKTKKDITVYYHTSGPKEGDMVTQALTAPYVLYALDNPNKLPINFEEVFE